MEREANMKDTGHKIKIVIVRGCLASIGIAVLLATMVRTSGAQEKQEPPTVAIPGQANAEATSSSVALEFQAIAVACPGPIPYRQTAQHEVFYVLGHGCSPKFWLLALHGLASIT